MASVVRPALSQSQIKPQDSLTSWLAYLSGIMNEPLARPTYTAAAIPTLKSFDAARQYAKEVLPLPSPAV